MPTQEDGVGQVCRASLFPGQGMVDLTVLDRLRAPRVPAGSISGDYSASLPRCEQTFASPRVENFPGRREHDAANRRVACQPGKLRHRQCGSIVKSGRLCSGQSLQIDCRGNDRQEGAELVPRDPRRLPFLHHTRDLIWFQFFVRYFLSFIRKVNLCRMPDDAVSAPAARPPPAPAAHHTPCSPHRQTPHTEATRTQRTKARAALERTLEPDVQNRRTVGRAYSLRNRQILAVAIPDALPGKQEGVGGKQVVDHV